MAADFDNEDQEIVEGFIAESREMVEEIEPHLIELGDAAGGSSGLGDDAINSIFRLFHSLKGSAGFLNFENIVKVTHEAETLLDLFRQGKAVLEASYTDLLVSTCDFIRELLDNVEEHGNDKGFDSEVETITSKLSLAQAGLTGQAEDPQPAFVPEPAAGEPESAEPAEFVDEFKVTITPEMVAQFVQESEEIVDIVEQSFLEIEKNPGDAETLNTAFRSIHSFKGNCGFMGYFDLERLSHKMETALDAMKSGTLTAVPTDIKILLSILDSLREGVADISDGKPGHVQGCDLLIQLIDEMLVSGMTGEKGPKIGEILVATGAATPEAVEQALETQNKSLGEILVDMGAATRESIDSAANSQQKAAKSSDKKAGGGNIRVDLDKLDNLINLVGELVIAEVMVTHNPDLLGHEFENFEKAVHHLERITSELQDVAMTVRMIPVSGVFRKMIRLIHDLSAKSGKKIHLERIGEDTEIDKTVIEQISDPLVHIIRNSADHGIESIEERRKTGKPEAGTIKLEARHEGGEVLIKVEDDGAGLSRDRILSKAIDRGLVTGDGKEMHDEDVFRFIFEAGFSTAAQVTNVSGRGVGMDVVKKNIDQLKGRIEIKSEKGKGTTIVMRIPLTLAIIDGMLVRVGHQRYTIPLLAIKESFRPTADDITTTPDGNEYVANHGKLLPVVRLHTLYNIDSDYTSFKEGILVAVEQETTCVCLFADELLGQQQAVIKGLSDYYVGDVEGISGCTILGNGEVSLILDVKSLIERVVG